MKNDIVKYSLLGAGLFSLIVLGNVASQSIYTRTKIGTDTKPLLLSIAGGVAIGGVLLYAIKGKK